VTNQHVAEDMEQASELAARAGNDMIMVSTAFYEAALHLLHTGRLDQRIIEDAVRHILTVKFRMGLFEHPEKAGKPGCIGCEDHLKTALKAARESVVMLANDGHLAGRGAKTGGCSWNGSRLPSRLRSVADAGG
jgi:beta-glucosidase